MYGFGKGTAVIQGSSFQTCINSANSFFTSIKNVYLSYKTELLKFEGFVFDKFDLWPYLLINDQLIAILYSLSGLTNGCYYGAFEVWGTLGDYTTWIEQPETIVNSFAANFGFIYVNVRDLYFYVKRDMRTPVKTIFDVGLKIGQLYYFLFIS